jgi:hypothetical protein
VYVDSRVISSRRSVELTWTRWTVKVNKLAYSDGVTLFYVMVLFAFGLFFLGRQEPNPRLNSLNELTVNIRWFLSPSESRRVWVLGGGLEINSSQSVWAPSRRTYSPRPLIPCLMTLTPCTKRDKLLSLHSRSDKYFISYTSSCGC